MNKSTPSKRNTVLNELQGFRSSFRIFKAVRKSVGIKKRQATIGTLKIGAGVTNGLNSAKLKLFNPNSKSTTEMY